MTGVPDDLWQRVARTYRLQERLEQPALRAALELAGDLAGTRVLDAGSGPGTLLDHVGGAAGRPSSLVLVDSSPAMLDEARRRSDGTADLLRADIADMPLADGSVDVAFASYVLHVVPPDRVQDVLRELHRVLRAGGCLVTVTPMPARARTRAALESVARALSKTPAWQLGGLRPMDPRPALEQAGFRVERVRHSRGGYPSLCIRAKRSSGTGLAWTVTSS